MCAETKQNICLDGLNQRQHCPCVQYRPMCSNLDPANFAPDPLILATRALFVALSLNTLTVKWYKNLNENRQRLGVQEQKSKNKGISTNSNILINGNAPLCITTIRVATFHMPFQFLEHCSIFIQTTKWFR